MDRTDIESGKDDGDLLIGKAHAVERTDDDVIDLEDEDILEEETEEDARDLDFEPDYGGDA